MYMYQIIGANISRNRARSCCQYHRGARKSWNDSEVFSVDYGLRSASRYRMGSRDTNPFDMQIKLLMIGDSGTSSEAMRA